MSQTSTHNTFIFNEQIDSEFLFSLYEDDYTYIKEVFNTTLETLDEDILVLVHAFESRDIQAVRKAAHKLKPVFGFTGVTSLQSQICQFEQTCAMVTSAEHLAKDFQYLLDRINDGKKLL